MPFFQRGIGIRSVGFLCQLGIDPGDCPEIVIGGLDSKILSLDSSCPPMPTELRNTPPETKLSDCLALAVAGFHCLGGRPPGRIYEGRVYSCIKKNFTKVCCIKSTEKIGAQFTLRSCWGSPLRKLLFTYVGGASKALVRDNDHTST